MRLLLAAALVGGCASKPPTQVVHAEARFVQFAGRDWIVRPDGRNQSPGGNDLRVEPIGQCEHQITMLLIGFHDERCEIFRPHAGRFFGKHMTAGFERRVDHRWGKSGFHCDECQRWLFDSQ